MKDRAPLLNAPIVSAAQDGAAMDEHGADRECRPRQAPAQLLRSPASRKRSIAHQYLSSPARHGFRTSYPEVKVMLHMALVFLVIGLIAALLGFTTIAGASIAIAKFLAGLFLLLFLVFLILGLAAGRRIIG